MMKSAAPAPTLIPSPSISSTSSRLISPTSPVSFSDSLTSPTLSTPSSAIDPQTELYLQQLRVFNISQLSAMDPSGAQVRGSNASSSSSSSSSQYSGTVYDALLPRVETRGQSYKSGAAGANDKKGPGRR